MCFAQLIITVFQTLCFYVTVYRYVAKIKVAGV